MAVAAGVKVKAVAAAEVTALAGLAAEVRQWCFHRSIGVHPVLLSAAVAVVVIVVSLAGSSWLPGSCSRHSGANLPSESPAIGAALSGRKKTAVWR